MAVGNFVDVIPIIEDMKAYLPNVKPLKTFSSKHISKVKRSERSIYKDGAVEATRTREFMNQGFAELKCEPKKQGAAKVKAAQRFDLAEDHIDLKKAGQNNADGIRSLMIDLEKQFMEDPEFQQPDEPLAQSASATQTGVPGGGETATGNKFGSSSLRGSPSRTAQGGPGDKGKGKSTAPLPKGKDGPEEVELEKTAESVEYVAFRN